MLVVVLAVLVLAGGAALGKAIRYPIVDAPARTDAVYVLASPGGIQAVERGMDQVPRDQPIVISVTPPLMAMPPYQHLCHRTDRPVICVEPDPPTTRGEARNLGRLAAQHGWRSVTVVTHTSHITRSRLLMKRCFAGEVRMSVVDTENGKRAWAYAGLYETGALAKALATPTC